MHCHYRKLQCRLVNIYGFLPRYSPKQKSLFPIRFFSREMYNHSEGFEELSNHKFYYWYFGFFRLFSVPKKASTGTDRRLMVRWNS